MCQTSAAWAGETRGGDPDQAAGAGRKAGGPGKEAQTRRNRQRAQRPGQQPPHRIFDRTAAQAPRAPDEQRRQESQRRQTEKLQQQVGADGAQRPQPVGGVAQIGVVQAGVIGGIAGQRRQRRGGGHQQQQARAAQGQHAQQPVHGVPGVGQGIAHGAAPRPGVIDTADHP